MIRLAVWLVLLTAALAAQPLHEVCGACHNEPAADFQEHPHFAGGVSCDACHGESKAHREATGHKPPDNVAAPADQPAVCGSCHKGIRKEYEASKHGQLVMARSQKRAAACTTCHGTHAARLPAAIAAQCSRCHTELPASCKQPPPAAAAKASVGCMNCHATHTLKTVR